MSFIRRTFPSLALGSLLVVGVSYVAAQELASPSSSDEVSLAQATDAPAEGAEEGSPARPPHRPHRKDGVGGKLAAVEGTTLVVSKRDGETVRVPTDDETEFVRNGEPATISDLVVGDYLFARKRPDAEAAAFVRAVSAEEFERRREECRENPQRCRAHRRQERREWCREHPERCRALIEQSPRCEENPERCRAVLDRLGRSGE